jgi:hypothetical protein
MLFLFVTFDGTVLVKNALDLTLTAVTRALETVVVFPLLSASNLE